MRSKGSDLQRSILQHGEGVLNFFAQNTFVLGEQCVSVEILTRMRDFRREIAGLLIHRELSKQKQCGVMSLCEHYASHVKVKSAERAQSCHFILHDSVPQHKIRYMATENINFYIRY